MNTWIWSDLHLSHEKVIDYENRPFKNKIEMDNFLIKQWQNIVKKKETIFNLGDVSFYKDKKQLSKIIRNCPGYKVLILGNHDRGKSVHWWEDVGFNEVYKYPIIYKDFYIMSHEPVYLNDNMPYMNIHGHTHSTNYEGENYYNVCVEQTEYKPILLNKIIKKEN